MRNWGKAPHFLVALNCVCFSVAHAEEAASAATPATPEAPAVTTETPAVPVTSSAMNPTVPTPASPAPNTAEAARDALQQKASDSSSEKSLDQVFKASEKTYSLTKKGKFSMNYDVNYSFYRDSRVDIALGENDSSITRFRIREDAQHSFSNNIDVSYGLKDNLTLTTSLPLVYKMDFLGGKTATGFGDVSFGLRWQPIPLKRGLPSTTLFTSLSTATGDSPYEINSSRDLSTGKGYYSVSSGISMSKVTDPLVLFGSTSFSFSNKISSLNQSVGDRALTSVSPGNSLGLTFGFAYSLNYDVSMNASFQYSLTGNSRFAFVNGAGDVSVVEPQTQVSSSLNYTLSLRTSPKRIVNISMGYGLTEDSPDVTLGFSMPLEFLGLAAE